MTPVYYFFYLSSKTAPEESHLWSPTLQKLSSHPCLVSVHLLPMYLSLDCYPNKLMKTAVMPITSMFLFVCLQFLFGFETGSCCVDQANLCQPLPPKLIWHLGSGIWVHTGEPPRPALVCLFSHKNLPLYITENILDKYFPSE